MKFEDFEDMSTAFKVYNTINLLKIINKGEDTARRGRGTGLDNELLEKVCGNFDRVGSIIYLGNCDSKFVLSNLTNF